MGLFEDWDDGKGRDYLRMKVGTILGGVPNGHDFVPSIVLVVLYTLLLIPMAWRFHNKTLSFAQVWRPLIVVLTRIASFAIRIKLAEGQNWNKDLFVAELVLLRISPILLTSALISLFRDAVLPYLPQKDSPRRSITFPLKYFVSFLQFATYFCLGLTIAIAFDVKQAINGNAEARIKLHRSKEISIYLLLVVNAMIYFLSVIPFIMLGKGDYNHEMVVTKEREVTKFTSLLAVCTFLLVVAGFKTAQLASHDLASRIEIIINKKILFYGICVSGEYIACALFAMIAWNVIVPPRESHDLFLHTAAASRRNGPGPEMREGIFPHPDSMCPTYAQQAAAVTGAVGGGGGPYTSPQIGSRGSFNNGLVVETRPYFDPNGHPINSNMGSSYYMPRDKRGSTQTLSTISEVRRPSFSSSPSKSLGYNAATTRRATSCGGEIFASSVSIFPDQMIPTALPSPWLKYQSQPPPHSATESVKSHWSDDSEDDKKGFAVGFNLMKSTRDSLTRKSSKGSKTSSNKGDKTVE